MADAITDPQTQSVYDSTSIVHVENTEIPIDSNERINQQKIIPVAIKSRLLGNLITNVPPQDNLVLFSTFTVPTSTSVSFLFDIEDPDGRQIFVMPLIGFFVASAGTQSFTAEDSWPNHIYGMGNCPVSVFNDVNTMINNDRTITNNVVVRAIMRNNTGAPIEVLCQGKFRLIANPAESSGNV